MGHGKENGMSFWIWSLKETGMTFLWNCSGRSGSRNPCMYNGIFRNGSVLYHPERNTRYRTDICHHGKHFLPGDSPFCNGKGHTGCVWTEMERFRGLCAGVVLYGTFVGKQRTEAGGETASLGCRYDYLTAVFDYYWGIQMGNLRKGMVATKKDIRNGKL